MSRVYSRVNASNKFILDLTSPYRCFARLNCLVKFGFSVQVVWLNIIRRLSVANSVVTDLFCIILFCAFICGIHKNSKMPEADIRHIRKFCRFLILV